MSWSYVAFRSSWTDGRWRSSAASLWWTRELETETGSTSASLESREVWHTSSHRPAVIIINSIRVANLSKKMWRNLHEDRHFQQKLSYKVSLFIVAWWLYFLFLLPSCFCLTLLSILHTVYSLYILYNSSFCIFLQVIWVLDTLSQRSEWARCVSPRLVGWLYQVSWVVVWQMR